MRKSTMIFLATILGLLIVAILLRNEPLNQSYADYTGCKAQEITDGCHADATRIDFKGLIIELSVAAIILISSVFGYQGILWRIRQTISNAYCTLL